MKDAHNFQPTAAHAASEHEDDDLDEAKGLVIGILWSAVLTIAIIVVAMLIVRL